MSSEAGLREKSVGLRGDWIASITNVAPTAATTLTMAALIGASGLASPLALLIAGAAMLCCAVAYHRLNAWQASAAAPVHWVARGLSPIVGFAVGILILMTALTSNIGNITLIGSTVLSLIAPSQTSNKPLTWVVATVICLLVVAIAVVGVKVTIRFEGWVVLVEYLIIGVLAVWGLVHELTSHAGGVTHPSWGWFTSSRAPGGSTGLIAGVVIASFATTIQSQIVDGSRIMFGMSRDRTVPRRLGVVHRRFATPIAGLIVMGIVPVLALVLYLASSSLEKTIVYIDSTGGLLFAGYYVVISLYSIWYYRSVLLRDVREFLLGLLLPLAGAGTLVYVIVKSMLGTAAPVRIIALVLFLIGIPLALVSKAVTKSPFFTTRRERYVEDAPVPADAVS